MPELSKEIAAYDNLRNELETDHFGEWVIVRDENLVGTFPDFQDAAAEAVRRFGRGPYLIRRVGAPPLTLPPSVMYRPVGGDH